MFCPKCATQNVDGASYCRACGANIGLVSQALTGQFPTAPERDRDSFRRDRTARRRKRQRDRDEVPASLERSIVKLFAGLGFLIAGLAVMFKFPGGFTWGWAFFIPGFASVGKGVAGLIAANTRKPPALGEYQPPGGYVNGPAGTQLRPAATGFKARQTGELRPPVTSVTDRTTRHLEAEAPTRHFDSVTGEERTP